VKRFRWNPLSKLSFRSKLIISNAILASVIVIILAYYLISRATANSDFLASKLTQAAQDVTENELRASATRFASDLDQIFGLMLTHMETIASALRIEMANEDNRAPISASSFRQLPNGTWEDSTSGPGSIFIFSQEQIPEAILSEISVVRQIDLIVPSIMEKNPDLLAVYFGSVLGEVLYYPQNDFGASLPSDFDVTQQSWFANAGPEANPTRGTICSDPYHDAAQKPVITCSTPVYDLSDQFRGVVAMDIDLAFVQELVSQIPVGKTGYAVVIDSHGYVIGMPERGYADFGIVVAQGEDPLTISVLTTAPFSLYSVVQRMANGLSEVRTVTIDGVKNYFVYRTIPTVSYSLALVVPVDEMQGTVLLAQSRLNADRRGTLSNLVTGSVVVLIIFLATILWLGTALTSPIVRLTRTAKLIAEGDINRTAVVESNDEIGVLAGTLNLMTKNLRELINDLERRVADRTDELRASNINLEQRLAELAIINKVQEELAAQLEFQRIIDVVGEKLGKVLNAESSYIALYNRDTQLIEFPYWNERGKRLVEVGTLTYGEGITSRVLATGEPLLIGKQEDLLKHGAVGSQGGAPVGQSWLGVPLRIAGENRGVLGLYHDTQQNAFSDSDLRLLQTLANSMSIALENARLYQETQRRAQEIATVAEIGREISATLDLSIVLERIALRAMDILRARDVVLRLLEPDGRLPASVAIGKYADIYRNWDAHLGKGLSGSVAETGIAEIINDPENDPRVIDIAGTEEDKTTRVTLFAPLLLGESVIGVLSVWRDKVAVGPFTQADLDFAVALARQAAIAIQNARLFAESQQRFTETEILRAANVALTKTFDLDAVLGTLLDYLQELVPYDSATIFLLEQNTELVARAVRGYERFTDMSLAQEVRIRRNSIARIDQIIDSQTSKMITDTIQEPTWTWAPTSMHIRSWLAVPLIAGGETIGLYSLDKAEPGFFTPEHQRLAEILAAQAAIAIQNATLYRNQRDAREQAESQSRQMAALNRVAQAVTSTLDLQTVLEIAAREMVQLLDARSVGIALLNDDKSEVRVVAYYSRSDEPSAVGLMIPVEGNLATQQVIETGQPILIPDAQNTPLQNEYTRAVFRARNTQCILILPLLARGEVIGTIGPDTDQPDRVFTPEEIQLAQTITNQLAGVIENARLFDETQRLLKETEQRAAELAIINGIGQTLTEELDLNTMVERVGEKLREALNLKNIGIGVYNEKENVMQAAYVYRDGRRLTVKPFALNAFNRRVSKAGRSLVVSKDAHRHWLKLGGLSAEGDIPQSFVMVPLMAGRELVGGITLQDFENENAFADTSISLLETIASNMGTAILNARLFDETNHLFKEAEEARAAAERANKAKSTFLANMSHELRTPLNAIMGFTRIVRKKANGALPEKQIENLDKVLSSSEHLLALINTVLDLAKIEAGRMDVIPAKFNMSALADQCANLATSLLKPKVKLEKQVDETTGIIFSDQDKIKQIVLNLLSNAAKFTHAGRILLSVEKSDPETLNISVTDSGIGISASAIDRVFEEFQQADATTTRQYGGTGLGLPISRSLARLLGGDLTATSELGKGSTFTLTIPLQYGGKPAAPSDASTLPAVVSTSPQPASVQSTDSNTEAESSQS